MDTTEQGVAPGSAEADLDAIIDHLVSGRPLDPQLVRRVEERGERLREEILQKHGVLNVAADLIREGRDEE